MAIDIVRRRIMVRRFVKINRLQVNRLRRKMDGQRRLQRRPLRERKRYY